MAPVHSQWHPSKKQHGLHLKGTPQSYVGLAPFVTYGQDQVVSYTDLSQYAILKPNTGKPNSYPMQWG